MKPISRIFSALALLITLLANALNVVTVQAAPGDTTDDWLHVVGNQVVDAQGRAVWMTGANWFGFNTGTNAFDGLWSVNLEQALDGMAARGINILRVPISTELVNQWKNGVYPMSPSLNDYVNPNLKGKDSLQIFEATLAHCKKIGIKVLLDIHSAKTDAMGHIYPVWYNGAITNDVFMDTWVWLADRYKNDDTIIAFDLKNEPHGKPWQDAEFAKWDNSTDGNNWKYIAEETSKRILAVHPNILIMIEGNEAYPKPGKTYASRSESDYYNNWWGGNLRGVKDLPIQVGARQSQIMYSPHDYGPAVYRQPWFYPGFNKDTLYNDVWRDNWMFIHEQNIAPLLIGEWGGFMDGGDNEAWMEAMRDLIIQHKLHHTFWCYNANSGDTGGLVGYDFITWDEAKYAILKPTLWQKNGKFVSLDHQYPLGSSATGMSLSDYYGTATVTPTVTATTVTPTVTATTVTPTVTATTTTPTVTATTVTPTSTPTAVNGLKVQLAGSGNDTNQQSSFKFRVQNTGSSARSNISVRIYFTADGSNSGAAYALEKYYDQSGVATTSGPTQLSGSTYFFTVNYGTASLSAGASWEYQTALRLGNWGSTFSGANDWWHGAGSLPAAYTDWLSIPAYLNGIPAWGVAPDVVVTNTPTVTVTPTLTVTPTVTTTPTTTLTPTVTATPSVTVTPTSTQAASCQVKYSVGSQWGDGFNAEVIVTNHGAPITSWVLTWAFPGNQKVVNAWNATVTQSGQNVSASSLAYNGNLATGGSASFGFQGSYSGTNSLPASFSLNGAACSTGN